MKKENADYSVINPKTCFLSTFPPRECGIATFTRDLSQAMDKKFNPKLKSKIISLNENECLYNYNKKVILQVNKDYIEDYIKIAKKVNETEELKIISVQHEFGLFGGDYGSYLIPFLETVQKPVVVTFHSVLPTPDEMRKRMVREIASRAAAIIVMANIAVDILEKDYGVEREKIHVVPHGIPNVKFKDSSELKSKLKLNNRIVLSTFGLLSKGKGIEYMIKAMPDLVKKYPNILYLIIGETHPNIRKNEGERYRNSLIKLVKKLKIENNVKFYNKYLTLKEIVEYLQASDVYICTNLERNQITSGTLAYALGCGKAVVSTPNIYAEEILADNRGVLAKFKDPESYAKAVDEILSDKEFKTLLEKNAYSFSRSMIWSNVAYKYLTIFNKIVKLREEITEKFPIIKLNHMINLTDDFGMVQFSKHSMPDKTSGYTLDDNSRALIASVLHDNLFDSPVSKNLSKTYLNFIEYCQEENGNFKNNHKNQAEITNPYSEDAFGRAIWSLGTTINKSKNPEIIEKAKTILNKSLIKINELNSPRAKAFTLVGLSNYYKTSQSPEILQKIKELSDGLTESYLNQSSEDWQWFEPYLTYANAKLPEALFASYEIIQDPKYLEIAEKTLKFLSDLVIINDKLFPIGENGWYNRNNERAFFDQQPIDASSMVQAFLTAYSITKNKDYYTKAIISFNWFLGSNHLGQMIYDEATGGCFDGLGKHSLNFNQGAESTISYLLSRLFLEEIKRH